VERERERERERGRRRRVIRWKEKRAIAGEWEKEHDGGYLAGVREREMF